jgi:hypothetical protein
MGQDLGAVGLIGSCHHLHPVAEQGVDPVIGFVETGLADIRSDFERKQGATDLCRALATPLEWVLRITTSTLLLPAQPFQSSR